MSTKRPFSPSESPPALGPYNHGVQFGNLLFTAGQIPIDPESGALVGETIEDQTRRVLENLQIIVHSQGLELSHVIKTTIFMTDLGEFQKMNGVYASYFTEDHPARSTIQVAALPLGARIEIEAVAHYD